MARKARSYYRIRRNPKNEFEAYFGKKTFTPFEGGCILFDQKNLLRSGGVHRVLFEFYSMPTGASLSSRVHVTTTCGIDMCVKREHQQGKWKISDSDRGYLTTFWGIDSRETCSRHLGVPPNFLDEYEKDKNVKVIIKTPPPPEAAETTPQPSV